VQTATTGSPEYLGNTTSTAFNPGPIAGTATRFWRVDEHVGAGILPGDVWLFGPAMFNHWKLDETSGFLAADESGTADGAYSGPTLGIPGATPSTGTAIDFDGINDFVLIPALDLESDTVTLTMWLKRTGEQPDFAGIVFSRAGATIAGLNFGENNELRYHWNGGNWGWDSGLVPPDGQWVFVALVIEPERATMHVGQGGELTSAVNEAGHSPEAFDAVLTLGRDPGSGVRWFRGSLDELRIYDEAFTKGEILALYTSSL
jgi:hypothetical protein